MNYNYHMHTIRCAHASGTPEEYVLRAIEGGLTHIGFSDHMPHRRADGHESGYRVPVKEGKIYCDEIKKLAEKYQEKIDISVGFEMEYYPDVFEEMLRDAKKFGAEYLILGQHFFREEGPGDPSVMCEYSDKEKIEEYVRLVIGAMEKGVFSYIAHPDALHFVGDADIYREGMRPLIREAKRLNVPLEINCLGIRDHRHYPNREFWRVVGEEGAPVTIGFDAHDSMSAYDEKSILVAKEMIREFGLNYIGKPELIRL